MQEDGRPAGADSDRRPSVVVVVVAAILRHLSARAADISSLRRKFYLRSAR